MWRKGLIAAALGATVLGGTLSGRPAEARVDGAQSGERGSALRERLRARLAGRDQRDAGQQTDAKALPRLAAQTIAYGRHPLQTLDLSLPRDRAAKAPLVIFVHGGGWKRGDKDNATGSWKAPHYTGEGYAFASINYRLVPDCTVEQQAADVAAAVRALIDRADSLGIDGAHVVLMGHSAGAHLVALVGTDEQYLRGAGLSFAHIKGVIPIDGAAYDVPAQMADGPPIMQATYRQAFGTDPARQRALSPTLQAGLPNAPSFLLLHVQRPDGVRQAEALASALQAAGTSTAREGFPGEGLQGHAEINRSLGKPDYPATPVVDRWLAQVFRR